MSSVGGHGLFSLCSLPSINEDDERAFLRSGSGSGARPSSPNLLGGLPEGIKRERTPFHREERASTPVAAAPTSPPGLKPSPMSPSKKRKLGSGGNSSSSNGVRSPGAPANRKSPAPAPRQPATPAAAAPVRAPIPLISVPGLPSAIANIIASNLNPALLRQLQQRRSQQQLQAQPQPPPQRQLRPLPVLQRTKSTNNKENKENSNGLHFTVTRFAAASRDARRPQRRSKRGGPGEVTTLTAKNMNIKDYLEALESVEKLNQWKRARRTEEDILEEELKEEMEEEEEGKERDPVSNSRLPCLSRRQRSSAYCIPSAKTTAFRISSTKPAWTRSNPTSSPTLNLTSFPTSRTTRTCSP
ncbi:hypothetical protein SCHPADRAFT_220711 [Schizopora paradoxa]|uniref:Uncharacterized protein n=1 Tax=Schizopora paradoxa TaxID=27342 RepID=A0A0H2RX92_9AGAM|nr:hypothetical protein SCHPADRAFT_220711 [Schizopora paradoxa]